MNYYEMQQEEIATIKPREFNISLSDADVERIYEKAGESGLTPEELLQNFIGDLVYGTYSNGSDERQSANAWFDRCYFANRQNESLLSYLLGIGEVENFLSSLSEIEDIKEEIQDTLADDWLSPKEIESDVSVLTKNLAACQSEVHDYFEAFMNSRLAGERPQNCSFEVELQKVLDWKESLTAHLIPTVSVIEENTTAQDMTLAERMDKAKEEAATRNASHTVSDSGELGKAIFI